MSLQHNYAKIMKSLFFFHEMIINFTVKNVIKSPGKKLKSFNTFRSLKSNQWSQKIHSNKKKKQKEDVVINIGLMRISDSKLKPKCGKRVAPRVSTDDTYYDILEKAVEKCSTYHSDCYCDGNYMLVFDNCTEASTMPGINIYFNTKFKT